MRMSSRKRLRALEKKVAVLWPDPKVVTIMDSHNANRTRPSAVDPTVGTSSTLHSYEEPWPVGIGGAAFSGDGGSAASTTYFTGEPWFVTSDSTEAKRTHLNEILRPLDAIEDQNTTSSGITGGSGTAKFTRSGDVIKVFAIRCKVSYRPNWGADELHPSDFVPSSSPRMRLMWVDFGNRKRVQELVRRGILTDSAPLTPFNSSHLPSTIETLLKPNLSEMFANIAAWKYYPEIVKYNTDFYPFTSANQGEVLYESPRIYAGQWDRYIARSEYLRNGGGDFLADGPPFLVLRDLDFSPVCPVKELHGYIGNHDSNNNGKLSLHLGGTTDAAQVGSNTVLDSIGHSASVDTITSANVFYKATDGTTNVTDPSFEAWFKPSVLNPERHYFDFDLEFKNPLVVKYQNQMPDMTAVDDAAAASGEPPHANHSSWGSCTKGLSLCVISTNTNNFWDLRVDCKVVFFDGDLL